MSTKHTDTPELSNEARLIEAILFASTEPLSTDMLCKQVPPDVNVLEILHELKALYAPRGVNLVETDGFWSFRTAADLAGQVKMTSAPRRKLPRAAAEVLAIIAYHQPVTRGDIESIRGVETSRGTLDILLELGWIRPGKRRETPGHPLTWQTTQEFLSHFNLENLADLPGMEELKAAGLFDARPVLSNLPREQGEREVDNADTAEDDDFSAWISVDEERSKRRRTGYDERTSNKKSSQLLIFNKPRTFNIRTTFISFSSYRGNHSPFPNLNGRAPAASSFVFLGLREEGFSMTYSRAACSRSLARWPLLPAKYFVRVLLQIIQNSIADFVYNVAKSLQQFCAMRAHINLRNKLVPIDALYHSKEG